MGDRDRKGINMIPEISMHMSKGVIKKKNEKKKKSAATKLNKSADGADSPEVGDRAAAGSNRQRQEES